MRPRARFRVFRDAPEVVMQVEVWSDVVCPWCYIGKRRFEKALAQFEHRDEVKIRWRSYQLDANAPKQTTLTMPEILMKKYGMGPQQMQAMFNRVEGLAKAEGLDYRLATAKPANTFDAHRLQHLAYQHGLGDKAHERFFKANFTENKDLNDHDTIVRLVTEVGVPEAEARRAVEGDDFAEDVKADVAMARQFGITGVPTFVIDRKYGVTGAQEPETILGALRNAWDKTARA